MNPPQYLVDQYQASDLEASEFTLALASIQETSNRSVTLSYDPRDATRAVNVILRHTGIPAMCSHIDRAPIQPGWWIIGASRHLVKCRECVESLVADPETVLRTIADHRCEICLTPATWFHADTVQLPVPHRGGIVSVIAGFEACGSCHRKMTGDDT